MTIIEELAAKSGLTPHEYLIEKLSRCRTLDSTAAWLGICTDTLRNAMYRHRVMKQGRVYRHFPNGTASQFRNPKSITG